MIQTDILIAGAGIIGNADVCSHLFCDKSLCQLFKSIFCTKTGPVMITLIINVFLFMS